MKITRVEPIHLRLPDVNERCDGSQETLVVKVHTDEGIVGVGEADTSALVGKAIIEAPLSHKICRGLAECVVGQGPFEIDLLVHRMVEGSIFYGRQGAAIQAMSGVEIALWDIVGKAVGRPVYQLLGGGFDVAQVAVTRVGGLARSKRIGWASAERHRLCVNHSYKTGVNIAASLHFVAALPNTHYFEYCVEPGPLRQHLTRQKFPVIDGNIAVPEGPGLGVELDEAVVARYRVG